MHGSERADGNREYTKGLLDAGLGISRLFDDVGRDGRQFVRQEGHDFFPQCLLFLRIIRDVIQQGAGRVAGL